MATFFDWLRNVLRGALALATVTVIGLGAISAPGVLARWMKEANDTTLYAVAAVFPLIAMVAAWFHRRSLTEYIIVPQPRWIDVLAHISGTSILFSAGCVVTFFLVLLVARALNVGEGGIRICAGLGVLALLPQAYYAGRVMADLLTGEWSPRIIAETDPTSIYHPNNAHRRHGYTTEIPRDHMVSWAMTLVPMVIMIIPGILIYVRVRSLIDSGRI